MGPTPPLGSVRPAFFEQMEDFFWLMIATTLIAIGLALIGYVLLK